MHHGAAQPFPRLVIALAVGTAQDASWANRHNAIVKYAVTCAGSLPSERFSRAPQADRGINRIPRHRRHQHSERDLIRTNYHSRTHSR